MPGYTYLWEFIVKPHHCDEFQREYGPGGPWGGGVGGAPRG